VESILAAAGSPVAQIAREGEPMNAPYHPCPDDELLQECAAGLSSPEQAERTMQHASRCKTCGPALQRYVREFSLEETPENTRIFEQLESSKPAWQRRLVRELFPLPPSRWTRLIPVFAGFAAVLIFVVLFGPHYMQVYKLNQAKKDVAAAFAERRTNEPRLTATDYSSYRPFPTILGPERSVDELPSSLHNALSAAIDHLKDPKADPRWLQIQGRVYLWEATPSSLEKAEKNFEKARAEGLNTPDLEIDLAAVYYARDNNRDTIDLLEKVRTEPKLTDQQRASALFNLALAYEGINKWDAAVETWEKYLQVDHDPSSGWAEEAKRHLNDAKPKVRESGHSNINTPAAFLQLVQSEKNQIQVEEYQDVAITTWLPEAMESNREESWKALRELGGLLASQHSDTWLNDLFAALRPPDLPAVQSLALAIKKNAQGQHQEAREQAHWAAERFARHGILSGELRAGVEEVNAFRRALNGADCLARAGPLSVRFSSAPYPWLKALLSQEKAECANLTGAFDDADNSLKASRDTARQHDFPSLELRDIGMSAGNLHLRGEYTASWQQAVNGLGLYWKSSLPLDRAYQFYSVMLQCALETGSLYAGEAFLRHAIHMREQNPEMFRNHTITGMLHLHLANVLFARNQKAEAEREKERAAQLIPPDGLPPQFELTVKLEPAEFLLQQGDAKAALALLEPLLSHPDNPDNFFLLRLNQILGDAYFKNGQLVHAKKAYQDAIATADSALAHMADPLERLLWLRTTDEAYRGQIRVLIEQGKAAEALQEWERYGSRALIQHASLQPTANDFLKPVQFVPLTQQRPAIPRLIYAIFKDGIQIWIVQDGRVRSQWVSVSRRELENTTNAFLEDCSKETSKLEEVQELGAKLFSLMVQPVIPFIGSVNTLAVELDPRIYNLPLEALTTPDHRYLAQEYTLIYSPGSAVERTLRSAVQIDESDKAMLVDASHARNDHLPGFGAQKAEIQRLFKFTRVVDSANIKWAQARIWLPSAAVVHYMGHGEPDGSGTGLDYDATTILRTADFTPELLQHSKLIVLAACSGGAGREYGLADSHNLLRAFFRAGVPLVVASRWDVDSELTSELMVSFYEHLAQKESVAQAMYNARISILSKKWHPYYWAGFSVSGRSN
jgi:CHAT domain-containing protein